MRWFCSSGASLDHDADVVRAKHGFALSRTPNRSLLPFCFLFELQRDGIHTVPLIRRRRAVVEDVAKMGVAPATEYFYPVQAVAVVLFQPDALR